MQSGPLREEGGSMANCKDCIHFEACKDFAEDEGFDLAQWTKEHGAWCTGEFFKNKSLFIELPCKPGDVVFALDEYVDVDLCEKCDNFCWGGFGDPNSCEKAIYGRRAPECITISEEVAELRQIFWWMHIEAFGKSVFLTREDAEKALEERRGGGGK